MSRRLAFFAATIASAIVLAAGFLYAQVSSKDGAIAALWKASPHADVTSEAFTHWDKEGAVPVACATCHSGEGLRDYLGADGSAAGRVDKPAPVRSAISCNVCHNDQAQRLSKVTFPSGFSTDNVESSAVCMICHQGRSSTKSVDNVVSGLSPDTVNPKLRFVNVHYRAAAATLFGGEAMGGYQYKGKTYSGKFKHTRGFDSCADCHDAHTTKVKADKCGTCHAGKPVADIRFTKKDFDGNGNVTEGIHAELASFHAVLGKAIGAYAAAVAGQAIAYEPMSYPYFFTDRNANGKIDKDEADRKNAFARWTPRLLQAAYNYQFVAKDPGAFAHNPMYALQFMFDSIESMAQKIAVPEAARLKRP